jgi:hypothetical protein
MVLEMSSSSTKEMEVFDCGSISMRRVDFFLSAKAAAKLTAVVVLPTPPF